MRVLGCLAVALGAAAGFLGAIFWPWWVAGTSGALLVVLGARLAVERRDRKHQRELDAWWDEFGEDVHGRAD